MSFVRPAAMAAMFRWGESALAGGLAAICLTEAVTLIRRGDVLGWFAAAGAVLSIFWLRSAMVRALSLRQGEAPGVVEVREREIRYLGPLTGGIVDLDALIRIEVFLASRGGEPLWRLSARDGRVVVIPAAAQGAEDLIGVFNALPGFNDLAAAAALRRVEPGRHGVWQRSAGGGAAISGS